MSAELSEVVIIVLAGTFLMMLLVIFIISFFFIHQKRQQNHKLEKATLKAQFEQEIVNAENEIQDTTMKYISRELHDNVGQMLTLVKIQLNNLAEEMPENVRIKDSKEFIHTALTDIRALSKSLNSDNILNEGLEKAISFELDRVKKLGNYRVVFNSNLDILALDTKIEILIFRIFQELLQNILKHAKAKNIEVNLEETSQWLILELVDDGIGFDFKEKVQKNGYGSGAGLKNLMHRASLMNGTLVFKKGKTDGTRAILNIPL
jgi:signal transduction histidine kinase